ncbi:MAG: glutamine--tRNA ligase/YqeY domain fusion protein [Candidatus Omnitrophica bacterium]|nr:glutamine--tRNA ligase/YqeY domain fusion protein [Candidatus Omnitrophota bacterium]
MKPITNFIREIIDKDLAEGKNSGRVHTRFPPEPNGYLHIGHAKSICLNFGIAKSYKGLCNLRFDDSNPETENMEYVNSIKEDIKWLGFDPKGREYYASDYFEKLSEYAALLIKKEKAYVCDLSVDEISKYRGTVTVHGKESPYRNRTAGENLELFQAMKDGKFADGAKVLRAKIDMANSNMLMRDPVLYRIKKIAHYKTGDKWRVYPTYDFTHCLSDSIEGITHSICTLEFDVHRPLYDWILDELGVHHPQQIEFARLNLGHTVLSKRRLFELVEKKAVFGWDDPRMPTLSGLRRRGYTPESIRNFCGSIGVAKFNSIIDLVVLENAIRKELNKTAPRRMAVLKPLKVVITNYPDHKKEELAAINNPEDPSMGTRKVPFSKELYIERDDFMEDPPKKFYRLAPGREVRLRYAYFIKCEEVIKNKKTGEIEELRCTYDPATKGGNAPDGRKVKATLHWVSASEAQAGEVRLYDTLFTKRDPEGASDLNPNSMIVLKSCFLEPVLKGAKPGERFQFERHGYFSADTKDSSPGRPIFNKIVSLKDIWGKIAGKKKK